MSGTLHVELLCLYICVLGTRVAGDLKTIWYPVFTSLVCSVDTQRRLVHFEIGEWRPVAKG